MKRKRIVEIEIGPVEQPWFRPSSPCFACGQKSFAFGEARIPRRTRVLTFCRPCFNAKVSSERVIRRMYPGAKIERLPEGTERKHHAAHGQHFKPKQKRQQTQQLLHPVHHRSALGIAKTKVTNLKERT